VSFVAFASVFDSNNINWSGAYSSAIAYNSTLWQHYTYCTNKGTPSCSNFTGLLPSTTLSGTNEAGFSAWVRNGTTSFTMYTNGTKMVRGHHYFLGLTILDQATAWVFVDNLKRHWWAGAAAAVNMAPPNDGAKLNSITIV
jgi:hypothetical protein